MPDDVGVLQVIVQSQDFWFNGKRLYLPKRTTDVLCMLVEANGKTVHEDKLFRCFEMDSDNYHDRHLIYNIMCRLRKILGKQAIIGRPRVGWALTLKIEHLEDIPR